MQRILLTALAILAIVTGPAAAVQVVDFGGDYVSTDTTLSDGVNTFTGASGKFYVATQSGYSAELLDGGALDRLNTPNGNGAVYYWKASDIPNTIGFDFTNLASSDTVITAEDLSGGAVSMVVEQDGVFYKAKRTKQNSGNKSFSVSDIIGQTPDFEEFSLATFSTGAGTIDLSSLNNATAVGIFVRNGSDRSVNGFEAFGDLVLDPGGTPPLPPLTLLDLNAVLPISGSEVQYGNVQDADLIPGGGAESRVMSFGSLLLDASDSPPYNGPVNVYGGLTVTPLDGVGPAGINDTEQKATSTQLRWRGTGSGASGDDDVATAFMFDLANTVTPYDKLQGIKYNAENTLADNARFLIELSNGKWYITQLVFDDGASIQQIGLAGLMWTEFDPLGQNGTLDDIRFDPTGKTFFTMAEEGLEGLAVMRFGVHNQQTYDIQNNGLFLTDLELIGSEIPTAIPEPATPALALLALGGLLARRRREV